MTSLQPLITSIWALLPALVPHVFVAWVAAGVVVVANLALDARKGERMPLASSCAPGHWVGNLLTLFSSSSPLHATTV